MTKNVYIAILTFTLLSVALLTWRGVTRLSKTGETEPPRPVAKGIGIAIGVFGALVTGVALALRTGDNPTAGLVLGVLRVPEILAALLSLRFEAALSLPVILGIRIGFVVLGALGVGAAALRWVKRPALRAVSLSVGVLFLLAAVASYLFYVLFALAFATGHKGGDWAIRGALLGVGVGLFALGRSHVRKGTYRALVWWTGAVLGVGFAAAAPFAVPEEVSQRCAAFSLGRDIFRFSTLAAGVVFLLFVLSALLPIILDALEGRGFAAFVGARHVRATKSGFLTVISVLSMAGVAVSSCALCSVTSIMGGFGADLKRKILNNNAHIIVDVDRPGGFDHWQGKLDAVRAAIEPHGGKATPVVGGDAMGSSVSNTAGALVRGIDPETIGDVIDLQKNIEVGSFDYLTKPEDLAELPPDAVIGRGPGCEPYYKGPDVRGSSDGDPGLRDFFKKNVKVLPGVIIGKELAKSLHVLVGDEISLLSPMGELGPTGVIPRTKRFRVAAIFYSGMYEYDATHAYILLEEAQKLFSMRDDIDHVDKITNIDIRVPDAEKVKEMRPYVDQVVAGLSGDAVKGASYRARDWMEMNKNLFSALKLEKLATFIILSIAIAVASFCIVCTLLLMVTEKGKEIAILKALGASNGAIMRTFMLEGIVIGGIGTVFGVGTALAACTGLAWFGVRLDPDVYYIDRLPVNVNPGDYGLVAVAALVICTLATIYPAKTASDLSPLEGLRWE